jgi:NADPH:quinone reductase-like Zn-dependent oxidoreductase
VVVTTSSSDKFDILRRHGADHIINYRQDATWGVTARNLTANGEGFDYILDVGGSDTFTHSLEAIKMEGIITIIGFLDAKPPVNSIGDILLKICTVRGLHVGSREQMQEMMEAMETNGIQPVVDKTVFSLHQLKEGLKYVVSRVPSCEVYKLERPQKY